METKSNEMLEEDEREEERDTTFDPWADEGAQLLSNMAYKERDYISANVLSPYDFEDPPDNRPSDYRDPELVDPDEETLPPGEMEMIFENCFIM